MPDFLANQSLDAGKLLQIIGIVPTRKIMLTEEKTRHLSIAANELKKC